MRKLRNSLKRVLPEFLLTAWRRQLRSNTKYESLSRAETFSHIYRERLWGNETGAFDSGEGSASDFAQNYSALVRRFIETNAIRTVVDLGCGDFRVGGLIRLGTDVRYVGVDVVRDLVAFNQQTFGDSSVEFLQKDIVNDDLPAGDLCLIRQVLQHLSNAEIQKVLRNCAKYRFLLITEHLYSGPGVIPNEDMPHGPYIRVYRRSGVFLDQPPFNLNCRTVFELPYDKNEVLRTVLIEMGSVRSRS